MHFLIRYGILKKGEQGGVVLEYGEKERFLYIVVSQSGTGVSKILRGASRDAYTHVSLAFDSRLQMMYSYGRRRVHNPFVGGFVKETPQTGVFGHFPQAQAVVIRLPIDAEVYERLEDRMRQMYVHRLEYRYDYVGVFLAWFGVSRERKRKSYCSKFVAGELQAVGAMKPSKKVVRPVDFLSLERGETVFSGRLRDYAALANADQGDWCETDGAMR